MAKTVFVKRDGVEYGPFEFNEIQELLCNGDFLLPPSSEPQVAVVPVTEPNPFTAQMPAADNPFTASMPVADNPFVLAMPKIS